ncbi:BURP domain-containing protein 3-like [Amaranthus tricolor]|uniref:BURP domain-containing protein 3-like n=1 Tax=Amaranthus tricolor TaxID=29722 RepID=UPI00258F0423|nr:BURP domain-containing protein 3-like [Amaranthus tricolor]
MTKLLLLFNFLFSLGLMRMGSGAPASISPEAYWKLKLPNTLMPQIIKQTLASAGLPISVPRKALQPNTKDSLSTVKGYDGLLSYKNNKGLQSINSYGGLLAYSKKGLQSSYGGLLAYSKKGLQSSYGGLLAYSKKDLQSTNSYGGLLAYSKKGLQSTNSYGGLLAYSKKGLQSTNSYGGLLAYSKKDLQSTNSYGGLLAYSKKGLQSTTGYGGLLAYSKKGLQSTNSYTFSYKDKHDDVKESVHVDESSSLKKDQVFFVEKDLHIGTTMTLHFQKSTRNGLLLPRQVSNQIPFSSEKLQETLQILSIDPKSNEANVLAHRIELCELPTIEGVEKKCVTSLESMIDYVASMIGTNVEALTTEVIKESKMEFTIKGVKKIAKNDHEIVICHKMGYPYAVYFCHRTKTLRSYRATLLGKDSTQIEAIVACHKETNDFLDNYAKNVLKIIPGSTHICHFPPAEDTIFWVPK